MPLSEKIGLLPLSLFLARPYPYLFIKLKKSLVPLLSFKLKPKQQACVPHRTSQWKQNICWAQTVNREYLFCQSSFCYRRLMDQRNTFCCVHLQIVIRTNEGVKMWFSNPQGNLQKSMIITTHDYSKIGKVRTAWYIKTF